MSHELGQQIAIELGHLNHLVAVHRPLLEKCASSIPDAIELSALAALLHSFYTGTENIFKRIEIAAGQPIEKGDAWHRRLLDAVAQGTKARAAVISPTLLETLGEYLAFRHVFRQAYSYELR